MLFVSAGSQRNILVDDVSTHGTKVDRDISAPVVEVLAWFGLVTHGHWLLASEDSDYVVR